MSAEATLKRAQLRLIRRVRRSKRLRDHVGDWIFPPRGVETAPVTLSQRRVFILPTKAGVYFAMTLLLMLVGSINYNLSLGYGLTFLLAGTGIVSILHTWRNLAQLQLRPDKTEPVFAGEWARFTLLADNRGRIHRHSLAIRLGNHEPAFFDVAPGSETTVRVRVPARRRGLFRPGRFRIYSTYPLGLFYAWANVELDLSCLVYPVPEVGEVHLPEVQSISGPGNAMGKSDEDFAGLRNYRPGDSLRRIAWKSLARNDVFATKLFAGAGGTQLWFDYFTLPDSLGVERRLSRMTRWVLEATQAGLRYGMRLPGREIGFGAGEAQQAQCLEALALFRVSERR